MYAGEISALVIRSVAPAVQVERGGAHLALLAANCTGESCLSNVSIPHLPCCCIADQTHWQSDGGFWSTLLWHMCRAEGRSAALQTTNTAPQDISNSVSPFFLQVLRSDLTKLHYVHNERLISAWGERHWCLPPAAALTIDPLLVHHALPKLQCLVCCVQASCTERTGWGILRWALKAAGRGPFQFLALHCTMAPVPGSGGPRHANPTSLHRCIACRQTTSRSSTMLRETSPPLASSTVLGPVATPVVLGELSCPDLGAQFAKQSSKPVPTCRPRSLSIALQAESRQQLKPVSECGEQTCIVPQWLQAAEPGPLTTCCLCRFIGVSPFATWTVLAVPGGSPGVTAPN